MLENGRKLWYMSLGVLLLMIAISSFFEMERTMTKFLSSMVDDDLENPWLSLDAGPSGDWNKMSGKDIRSQALMECALIYRGADIKWFMDFYEEETYIQYNLDGVSEEYPHILSLIEDDGVYMIWQEEEVVSIVCR